MPRNILVNIIEKIPFSDLKIVVWTSLVKRTLTQGSSEWFQFLYFFLNFPHFDIFVTDWIFHNSWTDKGDFWLFVRTRWDIFPLPLIVINHQMSNLSFCLIEQKTWNYALLHKNVAQEMNARFQMASISPFSIPSFEEGFFK